MDNAKPRVMIIDDDEVICDILYEELSDRGYLCSSVFNGNDALVKLATMDFDVALVDIKLPGMSGIELLRKMLTSHPCIAAIMITGINNVDVAVETMKLGALDYIVKPFELDRVNTSIRKALETKRDTTNKSYAEMDAIARGVEAKLDSFISYSKMVTKETVDIAQRLGIADQRVQRWAAERARLESKRNSLIQLSLSKLERSPFAQFVTGMMKLYRHTSNLNDSDN